MNIIRLFIHHGNKYVCPFCGYSSKDLLEGGLDNEALRHYQVIGGGRRRGGCWKCGATDREKLVYLYLVNELKIFDNKLNILHIAPEKHLSEKISSHSSVKYLCGDLFCQGYVYPSYVHNMNILNLLLEDNKFDVVICNHVLEHVEDDRKAMSELYRVLKFGGVAILQVPISKVLDKTLEDFSIVEPHDREIIFGQYDHCRIYGNDYKDRLTSIGFQVEIINMSLQYNKYGINPNEDLYVCYK